MKDRLLRILSATWQVTWAITLVVLPVTSFPWLSRAAGGTLVAPLSLIPLVWLCLTFLPVYIFSRKPIPVETKPLLVFVIVAMIASAAALFLDIPSFKGYTLLRNNLESFVTLGIGLAFFFTTWMMAASSGGLNKSLLFINIGGILLLSWSFIQIVTSWFKVGDFPDWMMALQSFISITEIQGVASRFRVTGTTLEPSWLAHCLNMLYLPIWLGSTVARFSAFRFRLFKLSAENMLLVAGIVVMILTYSRIGLIAFGVVLLWFVIMGSQSLASWLTSRFFSNKPAAGRILRILLAVLLVMLLILAVGGVAYRLSLSDTRFETFFALDSSDYPLSGNLIAVANRLDVAERFFYWDLGWKAFEHYPVLGVGLGNSGMFTMEHLSFYAWKNPELIRVLYFEPTLPNTKSLWIRLLAETGLLGFAVFITWLIVLWLAARRLQKNSHPVLRSLGLAGQFTLLALLLEGFSIDTFALPYYWVALGLVTAASFLARQQAASTNVDAP